VSERLDIRRSISELLGAMTERHKAHLFEMLGIEPWPGLEQAVEAALDEGADPDDVLTTLLLCMLEVETGNA